HAPTLPAFGGRFGGCSTPRVLPGTTRPRFALQASSGGNWRLVFAFEDGDAILVDYMDYH
ncbi:MAG: hypothetical protein U7M05_09875, partial [Candidatus Igneacidithiobacillus chanchocoensis]